MHNRGLTRGGAARPCCSTARHSVSLMRNPQAPGRVAVFAQALGELGWTVGRNVQFEYRWGAGGGVAEVVGIWLA